MRVFRDTDGLQVIPKAVVTVGSFDGVHYGHRALLHELEQVAARTGGQSVVVTLWPHPRNVLHDGVKLLNTLPEKLMLLEEAGIDNVVVLTFTREFAALRADQFIREVLVKRIGMRHLVVGYNHHFGSDHQDHFDEAEAGFTTHRIRRYDVHEEKVSSTIVRNCILAGDMTRAAELLTAPYPLIAAVASDGTLAVDRDKLLPPAGDYRVRIGDGPAEGVLRIAPQGVRLEADQAVYGTETLLRFI